MACESDREYLSLQRIQAEEYRILCTAVDYFEKNGIGYSLGYGTLIGAARHKGFIPWDDDIDLIVPRDSYDALLRQRDKFEFATGLRLEGLRGISLSLSPIAKVVNPAISVLERGGTEGGHLWIDLFPLDGLPDDGEIVKKVCRRAKWLHYVFVAKTSPVSSAIGFKRKAAKALLKALYFAKSPEAICSRIGDLAKSYPLCEGRLTSNLTFSIASYGGRFRFTGIDQRLQFVDRKFAVINGWEDYLSGIYGDYMSLPREEDRVTHSVEAWISE
ncbi:phosphorylcholine transferase LicD [uncultured Adlercreutzia sp.]|uniref:LicD family protein n=1 Tax=uncultured Adlercreutzia sp. TaxID=875803 RepID=UPI0026F3984C|nr:LicD family protein [uncultured Adlercreutzia sp.]